jgi:hypothetical protein
MRKLNKRRHKSKAEKLAEKKYPFLLTPNPIYDGLIMLKRKCFVDGYNSKLKKKKHEKE